MPRDIPITKLRNIGIMAHIDAGKTTCAERILFVTGRTHSIGEVHHGDTVLDYDPYERAHGITIQAAATSVDWRGHTIQIVDTPGHVDFTVEVERSLRVLDGAVFVLDASQGVECQSETVFRQAERHGVPCVAFVNKVDKVGADFDLCLRDLHERLGVRPIAVHVPVGDARLLDVVRARVVVFDPRDPAATPRHEPVPEALSAELSARRRAMIEVLAEHDEDVLACFCEAREPSEDALVRALRSATVARRALVVTAGAALRNVGIATLLDVVVDYLPCPLDLPPVAGEHPDTGAPVVRAREDREPLAALAFKTVKDRAGALTYVRVYAGVLEAGAVVRLGRGAARARVGRLYLPHADAREEVRSAGAGAIVAVTGLRDVRTGETLSSPAAPIVLARIEAPEPVVEIALEPKSTDDRDRLGGALAALAFEDPSLRASLDPESGETRLRGMGKLHLEVAVEKLRRDHRVAVTAGKPEVAYRETIARAVVAEHRHVKQSGGSGQYACVTMRVSPGPRGSGVSFVDETTAGVVPREFVPAVEKGVRAAAARGVFAGYPVVDVAVALVSGDTHVKDSSAAAFEIAGSLAFQKACRAAGPVLLEPYCQVEIVVPDAHGGDVLGDLGARRASVASVAPRGGVLVIAATMPLAATFDYVAHLRGLTRGRGSAAASPAGYAVAPASVLARLESA